MRGENRRRYPRAERRIHLLQPRLERPCTAEDQRNNERANEEAAAQVVHGAAQQQWEVLAHGPTKSIVAARYFKSLVRLAFLLWHPKEKHKLKTFVKTQILTTFL